MGLLAEGVSGPGILHLLSVEFAYIHSAFCSCGVIIKENFEYGERNLKNFTH
jgi:hypothetical protein